MAPHFPQVTVNALRKHVASIRQRLGALSTTVSDLHDEKVIMNVANRLLHQQRWSKEQSDLLQVVYDKHGSNWDLVATLVSERGKEGQQELFPTRTTDECRNRIESSSLGYNRGPWSIEELERFWKAFKEVEADNKHKSRALKSKARGVGRMDKVDIGNLGAVDDGGGKDTRFVSGFWQLVADKVQTRNRTQCCRVYNNLISGRATETGKGRERKPWTVEELEALRDLKAGQSKSWEYGETNGNKSSAKMLTDEQREEALKFLMQTRNSDTVYWKALYVQKHAKACSMTVPDYLDGMIDKKRRLGHAENLAKERKQLIAAKMNSKIIGKKGR